MNDNKRLYKKLTTWFWWFIATMPVIFIIGYMLYYIFNKNYSGSFNMELIFDDIYSLFDNSVLTTGILFNKLYDMFYSLFEIFGITDSNNYFSDFIIYSLSWFILVHILHLIVDIILLLPRICQRFIERV